MWAHQAAGEVLAAVQREGARVEATLDEVQQQALARRWVETESDRERERGVTEGGVVGPNGLSSRIRGAGLCRIPAEVALAPHTHTFAR